MSQRVFETIEEAKAALRAADSSGGRALCSVWFGADKVTVHTAQGSGSFDAAEWRERGLNSSVEVEKENQTLKDRLAVTASSRVTMLTCRVVPGCVRIAGHDGFHCTSEAIARKEDR